MDRAEFLGVYGGIYEHSPWIAEAAFAKAGGTMAELHTAMKDAVTKAGREQKLALIRAHPDLACAEAPLTAASQSEQQGAGLRACTPAEFAEFQALNAAYREKFGFPFIIAVKGLSRQDILQSFRERIANSAEDEFETALAQIHKIAWFRLEALAQGRP